MHFKCFLGFGFLLGFFFLWEVVVLDYIRIPASMPSFADKAQALPTEIIGFFAQGHTTFYSSYTQNFNCLQISVELAYLSSKKYCLWMYCCVFYCQQAHTFICLVSLCEFQYLCTTDSLAGNLVLFLVQLHRYLLIMLGFRQEK